MRTPEVPLQYVVDHVGGPMLHRVGEIQPYQSHGAQLSGTVSVEVAGVARLGSVTPEWDDLVTRAAEPNAFMNPMLLRAAAEADPDASIQALLAWKQIEGRQRLVGVWGFSVGRPLKSPLPIRVLSIPPGIHGFLATPMLDRDHLDETLDAMLDCVAAATDLPKIMALAAMGSDGPVMESLIRVLAGRASAPCIFENARRPKLASELDGKSYLEQSLSSSTRKKLRQHRRRLGATGSLSSTIASAPEDVRRALEGFLMLEAAGWKGRQGTAILCDRRDAAFVRQAVAALAERADASVHGLYLDRRPVSMQIVLRCGNAAFTWKTAYDEHFQDFSPGMLLLEDYTTAFLADQRIAFVDSCAHDETSFMSAWSERRTVADLWLDARRGSSFAFRLWSSLQRNYRELRSIAKTAYLAQRCARVPTRGARVAGER
jgi:CelD/BcsL family acetyltransferase involved in cellulose biosynthesis